MFLVVCFSNGKHLVEWENWKKVHKYTACAVDETVEAVTCVPYALRTRTLAPDGWMDGWMCRYDIDGIFILFYSIQAPYQLISISHRMRMERVTRLNQMATCCCYFDSNTAIDNWIQTFSSNRRPIRDTVDDQVKQLVSTVKRISIILNAAQVRCLEWFRKQSIVVIFVAASYFHTEKFEMKNTLILTKLLKSQKFYCSFKSSECVK